MAGAVRDILTAAGAPPTLEQTAMLAGPVLSNVCRVSVLAQKPRAIIPLTTTRARAKAWCLLIHAEASLSPS